MQPEVVVRVLLEEEGPVGANPDDIDPKQCAQSLPMPLTHWLELNGFERGTMGSWDLFGAKYGLRIVREDADWTYLVIMRDPPRIARWTQLEGGTWETEAEVKEGVTRILSSYEGLKLRVPAIVEGKARQRVTDTRHKGEDYQALLQRIKFASAYRRALAKVGLKASDVAQRFTGTARVAPLNRRYSYATHAITYVETRDGRRVKLDPPVQMPKPLSEAVPPQRPSAVPPSGQPPGTVLLGRPPVASTQFAHFLTEAKRAVKPEQWKEFTDMLAEISNRKVPIYVPAQKRWWMAFPYGVRVAGFDRWINTTLQPSETIAETEVKNPYLPPVHRSYWRQSPFYK